MKFESIQTCNIILIILNWSWIEAKKNGLLCKILNKKTTYIFWQEAHKYRMWKNIECENKSLMYVLKEKALYCQKEKKQRLRPGHLSRTSCTNWTTEKPTENKQICRCSEWGRSGEWRFQLSAHKLRFKLENCRKLKRFLSKMSV